MLQLFSKYGEGKLNDDEKTKINKWVYGYEYRKLMFENLRKTIEFQKKLSVADEGKVKGILKELKEAFPDEYHDIPDGLGSYILLRILKTTVDYINWEMCSKIAKRYTWIRVVAFSVRVVYIILIVLIAYATFFHNHKIA